MITMKWSLLIALIVGAFATWVAILLDFQRKVIYNDAKCVLIQNVSPGSEDLVVVDNNLVLVSSGDIDRIFFKSGKQPREGGIFAISFLDKGAETSYYAEKLLVQGYPKDQPFNPHGIHFSNATKRVYAVNHECGDTQLEGIEVFQLERNDEDGSLVLVHERSIRSPTFPLGCLNDVVEGAFLGELYVTQWMTRPVEPHCKVSKNELEGLARKFDGLFRRKALVQRCLWDPTTDSASDVTCTVVAGEFGLVNGITASPDKRNFYIVDSSATNRVARVYKRNEKDGTLSLNDTVPMKYVGDNIEYDTVNGKLILSGSPLLYEIFPRMDGDASAQVSGGCLVMEPLEDGTYHVRDLLFHDGSKLSMVSSCVLVHGTLLMGSPVSDGVLACPFADEGN